MQERSTDGPLEYQKYAEDAGAGLPHLDDRDYACILLRDLDYDAQVRAIGGLLRLHRQAASTLNDEICQVDADARRLTGLRNQRAVDEWVDRMHDSVYQDAAHSMAAIGMLAPLVESIFYQALLTVRQHLSIPPRDHERWQHGDDREAWDCHFIWKKSGWSKDLTSGIFDLSAAVGLAPHLPSDLELKCKALFSYRNKMFHHGFEWPTKERSLFDDQRKKWPSSWFFASTSDGNGKPWIIYMTAVFVDDWVKTVGQIIEAIGLFARGLVHGGAAQHGVAAGSDT